MAIGTDLDGGDGLLSGNVHMISPKRNAKPRAHPEVDARARGADAPARPLHELSPDKAQLLTTPERSTDVTYIPYARPGREFAKNHPRRAQERNPNSNPNSNPN